MPNPSDKVPAIARFLEAAFGRTTAITDAACVSCGKPADEGSFRNELSRREYTISGLCQSCQDKVFGSD